MQKEKENVTEYLEDVLKNEHEDEDEYSEDEEDLSSSSELSESESEEDEMEAMEEYFEDVPKKVKEEDEYSEDEEDLGSSSELSESESEDDEMEVMEEEEYIESDNYDHVRRKIDEERLLDESVFESDINSDEYEIMEEECNRDKNFGDLVEEKEYSSEHERNQLSESKTNHVLDTILQNHIREHDLNLIPRAATRSDGNCWYDAIADQIALHKVPDKPTNHVDLRLAVCEAIPKMPQAKEWIQNLFRDEDTFKAFLEKHKTLGKWTDSYGIMCQATALFVGRNIHIVGTANIGQGEAYTKLESVEESTKFPPFTVGYYQEQHYQSLQEGPKDFSEIPPGDLNLSVNSEHDRRTIDEERLLDESVFESDINCHDSLTEMEKIVDKIRRRI